MERSISVRNFLRLTLLTLVSAALMSCGPENKNLKFSQLNEEDPSLLLPGTLLVKSMAWNTTNGGIAYSVAPVGNGASFSITVTRYAGVSRNTIVRLNSTDSNQDYQFVLGLFRGSIAVINNAPTTTNSTVVLENYLGQSTGYTNPSVFNYSTNPFTHLNQFIASRI